MSDSSVAFRITLVGCFLLGLVMGAGGVGLTWRFVTTDRKPLERDAAVRLATRWRAYRLVVTMNLFVGMGIFAAALIFAVPQWIQALTGIGFGAVLVARVLFLLLERIVMKRYGMPRP